MRRREFITLIGGAAAAWPLAARAQQPATPVVGFLNGSSATAYAAYVQAFISGLAETGLKVGENVSIEYRWAEGRYDRIPEMADDLVRRQVAVLAANTPAARAAKSAAGKIPLVFFTGEDPVAAGLVTSLNRPGGNATGVTTMFGGLAAKQVSLLRELVPTSKLIAFLVNPRNPITEPNVRDALEAARKLGQQIQIVNASSDTEIEVAFDTLREMRPGALLVQPDAFLINKRIVALAERDALPVMYQSRDLVAGGGLMSYGPSLSDQWRQMGIYVGKVLNGTNPGGLPVLQPTKFELAINMKTAKALGLRLSNNLLSLADELIE
ncbi:MAG: ABC transporter substrate-binding protein [Pseudolabrys sp.]|jgi:putative ABC transport system substrate-binding protein